MRFTQSRSGLPFRPWCRRLACGYRPHARRLHHRASAKRQAYLVFSGCQFQESPACGRNWIMVDAVHPIAKVRVVRKFTALLLGLLLTGCSAEPRAEPEEPKDDAVVMERAAPEDADE